MYAEERQQAIVNAISQRGRMSVSDLSHEFEVTTETVRRDLSTLEQMRLVRRVHGGAVAADAITILETALSERDESHAELKDRIATAAASQLPPGDATVLLDAGSTTGRLAEKLPTDGRLTVFTHSVVAAQRMAIKPGIEVHLLPGRVRPTTMAAVGPETVAALDLLRVDVAFIGTNGLSTTHGLSTPDENEAAAKRAIVACARRVVVLADSSKIGLERTVRFAELAQIDVVVTDTGISNADLAGLEALDIEVVVT